MKQFEGMTVGELKNLTDQYQRLELEKELLRIKYPNRNQKTQEKTAEELINEII